MFYGIKAFPVEVGLAATAMRFCPARIHACSRCAQRQGRGERSRRSRLAYAAQG